MVTVMLGDDEVSPWIDGGVATPFSRIQLGNALALYPSVVAVFELTVRVCAGGAGLLLAATQKLRLVGFTLIELFWAVALSRQPTAMSSTRIIDLRGSTVPLYAIRGKKAQRGGSGLSRGRKARR